MSAASATGLLAPVTLNGLRNHLAVDSLSDLSILTPETAKQLGLQLLPHHQEIQPAGNDNKLLCEGVTSVDVLRMGDKTVKNVRFYICDISKSCAPAAGIIGLDLFSQLNIQVHGVPVNFPWEAGQDDDFLQGDFEDFDPNWLDQHKAPAQLRELLLQAIEPLLQENSDLAPDSFCTHPSAEVHLHTGDAKPVYVPQYRVSDFMSKVIDDQVAKWAKNGVICSAPTDSMWNSPLLAALDRAAKAKGKDPRVCIDPRKINAILASDPRPIPDVREVHKALKGFKFISEIDLTKGFNQFPIAVQDRIKTTFTWDKHKWMFQGAPFGLKPLSQIFQGVIEQILSGVRSFATPFIDNIYVHTNTTMEDHAGHVCQVLAILNKWNLRINRAKCFFGYTAVNVLGHLVSGDSRQPDPAKVKDAWHWNVPQTGKDIERFLGFTNYLRDHIPNYAHLAAPLESLRKVRKITPQQWDRRCVTAFSKLRQAISMAPVLHTPLPKVPYCLATDASQRGLGWCLYQLHPDTGKERYILFGAKALNKAQVNYGATRRELLAIVTAIQSCRYYLQGQHFKLYTDHKALTYLFTQRHVNYMMLNYIDILFDYDFEIIHRPGIHMILPDALSRIYQEEPKGECGASRVTAVKLSESVSYPDKELKDFINNRFAKAFVEPAKRAELLQAQHVNGHFGAETLFAKIWHQGYYWPGLRSDCQAQVSSCLQCLRYNVGKSGYHTRQYITAELPFDHIAMDTITGFPTTERGNNVILVITDLCTRFKLLLPQQTKSAAETAANVWKVFCTFPLPKIVQSDNGTEFCNQVIKSLFDLHGVDHRTIAAYNPRANGSAESAVGSCQQVLRKLTNGNMKDWDDFLPSAQLALNSKANRSTKSSPASLLYGLDVNAFADYDRATSKLLTINELQKRQAIVSSLIRPTANNNFRNAQKKRTDAVNSKIRKTPPIPVGSLVMLKDPTRTNKHQPVWNGPYRVVRQKTGGTYTLQCVDNSLYHREPPRDHLKVIDAKASLPLDDVYFVERILNHKGAKNKRFFLIKWLNFPSSDNSWEPESNLLGCETLLDDYWRTHKALQAQKPKNHPPTANNEQKNATAALNEPETAAASIPHHQAGAHSLNARGTATPSSDLADTASQEGVAVPSKRAARTSNSGRTLRAHSSNYNKYGEDFLT